MVQEYTEYEIMKMKQRYYEIDNKIKSYKNEVYNNNNEINKLNERIDKLMVIKSNLKESNQEFDRYVYEKKNKIETLKVNHYNTKFARDCSEEILSFINSRETLTAIENINNSINEVLRKVNKSNYNIEELNSSNNTLKNRIEELEYEKRLILQKGVI